MKIEKKHILTAAGVVFSLGSLVTGLLSKDSEQEEIAKKAAEILKKENSAK